MQRRFPRNSVGIGRTRTLAPQSRLLRKRRGAWKTIENLRGFHLDFMVLDPSAIELGNDGRSVFDVNIKK
jgi:hypothetical protein